MTEARPSNSFLFPDLDVLFALDTEALMTYLSPHHKAICNSVKKKWAPQYHEQDDRSIIGWLCSHSERNEWEMTHSTEVKENRNENEYIQDGRQKEKRQKTKYRTTQLCQIDSVCGPLFWVIGFIFSFVDIILSSS